MNVATNGRYILAPTSTGIIFIWSLITGQLVGKLKAHSSKIIFYFYLYFIILMNNIKM